MVRTGSIEEISGHLAKRCSISCSRLHATLRVFWNDASEGASIAEFALAGFADSSVIRSVFQSPAESRSTFRVLPERDEREQAPCLPRHADVGWNPQFPQFTICKSLILKR